MAGIDAPAWTLVEIETHTDAVEAVTYALTELGAVGATSRQDGDDIGSTRARVFAYFPETPASAALAASTRDCLKRLEAAGLATEPGRVTVRNVDVENWATSWRSFFAPQRFGDRLMVTPSWEPIPPDAPQAVVLLDPGMAFGTGAHASTQLVLRALSDLPVSGKRIADIGTGSGILAIASAKLGASEVVAVDSDAKAVAVAASNVAVNGVADRVQLAVGTVAAVAGAFDIALMNILARVIVPALPDVLRLLRADGLVVFSGITDAEAPEVQRSIQDAGFGAVTRSSSEGWSAFLARPKRAGPSV